MTFDWFRRRFDQEEETAQPQESEASPPESASAEPAASESATDEVAEDYLNWAKVAYENIRKRQAEAAQTSEPEATVPATESELEVAAPVVSIEPPSTLEPTESAQPPEPITTDGTATAPIAEAVPESIDATLAEAEPQVVEGSSDTSVVADTEVVPGPTSEPASETASEAVTESAAVPFWLQAEADRQARLEQLRETAIVEPEPEPQPTASKATPEVVLPPDLVLDEGFLWSAEILASQGRRPDQISLEEITWLKRLR
ncbi:MAG TPA: signal recognition particle-docking protein FtsY, partial [Microcoleaceae cyanobacterium]